MEIVKSKRLPITKIEVFSEDDMKPWIRTSDLFLCSGFGPYLRVYWARKPTDKEVKEFRSLI